MKALFTVNFGDYDVIKTVPKWEGYTSILITDGNKDDRFDKTLIIPTKNPYLSSRYFKWMSHDWLNFYLPNQNFTSVIYFDANLELLKQPEIDFFNIIHEERKCVWDECVKLMQLNHRYKKDSIYAQIEYFLKQGWTDNKGLYLNGFFGRPHNEKYNFIASEVYKICEQWTNRDMLALPFVLWKYNLTLDNLVPRKFFNEHVNRPTHAKTHPILK
jgi:hypothetical protein